ncbi:MAG: aminotransferase class III-fold pyridoxal phosphate-dependent enzyme [Acidobacteria bacterium]|nr:aminotransferase class III-fold pyridoxal phosphate-dependent enzyme [Acidobacteriota bacterium]MBI3427663.1 aminotransferase class III-fold pyridoxal phosphate-dependent enzyme [Acidobacteriota bacterium]
MTLEPSPARAFNPETAARLAKEFYGLNATASALPGEYDNNFHLNTSDGTEYVLKIMHADRERALVEMQYAALRHLAERAPALALQRVCPALNGELIAMVKSETGTERLVWLLSYVPGRLLAQANPHTPELLFSLGALLGQVDAALIDFEHPATAREMKWDLARAGWIQECLHCIDDHVRRGLVERLLGQYESEVVPALPALRQSVIHNDANDYNVLVNDDRAQLLAGQRAAVSVIDFGDMLRTCTVFEVAIAAAYALLDKPNPLASAVQVIAGYHSVFPLTEQELSLLYPLICARLCVSVVNSAQRKLEQPDDPYITISERPAWAALEALAAIPPPLAHYTFRQACGLPPVPHSSRVVDWLRANAAQFASALDVDLRSAPSIVFDLSIGSLLLGADPAAFATDTLTATLFAEMKRASVAVGIGRYDEARALYTTPAFASSMLGSSQPTDEHRTVHLGIDLFVAPGAPVYAPLDGVVHCVANNTARLDYGPLLILRHVTDDGLAFFTLYGHLDEEVLTALTPGQAIRRGQRIARIGAPPTNGDWTPHLHFQLITDLLGLDRDFPGVAYASQREVWKSLSPDPNVILGIPAERFPTAEPAHATTLAARRAHVGRNLSISYRQPLKMVRGWQQYLYDETARAYLDVYNNVPLVGHSHPRVVRAAQQQLALLNTNTRYLHDNLTRYAERLTALMPEPLRVCYFLNSASEANELALRLARTYTGQDDVIVLEAAYHGHTTALIDISPYKFNGPGGTGKKPWVHIAPIPDDYRGPYKRGDAEAGRKYAQHVADIIAGLPHGFAAFIAETLPSVGGQIVLPPGYLAEVYRHVRAAGGVCIADEVQVGFGRLGTHRWGFETQGVVPDIVVLGKPIGNAFPLAAVVTTPELAASFDNGMEFFSTYGGNPVACAVGLAVLDVLEEEHLQANALRVGGHWLAGLRALLPQFPLIGDVRGSGLFLGIELVRDHATSEPAAAEASYIVNRLRDHGILAGTDGPYHNVIKLRPPLIFTEAEADFFIEVLARILNEDAVRG